MWFAPKIATVANILMHADARNTFGGTLRFGVSVVTETIFFILLSQIMWFGHALLIVSLPFGRPIEWAGQVRDDHTVSLAQAFARSGRIRCWASARWRCWPPHIPPPFPTRCFLPAGLALSIPLAVITALPATGRLLTRLGHRPPAGGDCAAGVSACARIAGGRGRARLAAAMIEALRTARGVLRSMRIYYGGRPRNAAMDAALSPVHPARRPRLRHRRACRRPRRLLPPPRRTRGRARAAAGAGAVAARCCSPSTGR